MPEVEAVPGRDGGGAVIVALQTLVTCPACGHKIRYTAVATVRVNRRSIRATGNGGMIGMFEDWKCPGCREEIPRDRPLDREPYTVVPEDAVKVAAYRLAKWGIESTGADVERVTP
jgi:ribosomal protein S27E